MNGIRVVEASIALSGPWAAGILADQGADVIKLEPPGIGDSSTTRQEADADLGRD
jgi:crotonobetainyl-CoA:carnitine CoA-transferase CaiB-like acyl-CoA transferase